MLQAKSKCAINECIILLILHKENRQSDKRVGKQANSGIKEKIQYLRIVEIYSPRKENRNIKKYTKRYTWKCTEANINFTKSNYYFYEL